MTFSTLGIPEGATLSVQCRVRHPRRGYTVEYWTLNARAPEGRFGTVRTQGDFGRWTDKADAQAALVAARLDLRTRRQTAFQTFAHLVDALYTPTLSDTVLADAYDTAQAAQGSDKRCHRRLPTPAAAR